jgi:hypothetical protein
MAEIVTIHTDVEGFIKNMSLQEACSELKFGNICSCKGDCSANPCYSWKPSGVFHTSLVMDAEERMRNVHYLMIFAVIEMRALEHKGTIKNERKILI